MSLESAVASIARESRDILGLGPYYPPISDTKSALAIIRTAVGQLKHERENSRNSAQQLQAQIVQLNQHVEKLHREGIKLVDNALDISIFSEKAIDAPELPSTQALRLAKAMLSYQSQHFESVSELLQQQQRETEKLRRTLAEMALSRHLATERAHEASKARHDFHMAVQRALQLQPPQMKAQFLQFLSRFERDGQPDDRVDDKLLRSLQERVADLEQQHLDLTLERLEDRQRRRKAEQQLLEVVDMLRWVARSSSSSSGGRDVQASAEQQLRRAAELLLQGSPAPSTDAADDMDLDFDNTFGSPRSSSSISSMLNGHSGYTNGFGSVSSDSSSSSSSSSFDGTGLLSGLANAPAGEGAAAAAAAAKRRSKLPGDARDPDVWLLHCKIRALQGDQQLLKERVESLCRMLADGSKLQDLPAKVRAECERLLEEQQQQQQQGSETAKSLAAEQLRAALEQAVESNLALQEALRRMSDDKQHFELSYEARLVEQHYEMEALQEKLLLLDACEQVTKLKSKVLGAGDVRARYAALQQLRLQLLEQRHSSSCSLDRSAASSLALLEQNDKNLISQMNALSKELLAELKGYMVTLPYANLPAFDRLKALVKLANKRFSEERGKCEALERELQQLQQHKGDPEALQVLRDQLAGSRRAAKEAVAARKALEARVSELEGRVSEQQQQRGKHKG